MGHSGIGALGHWGIRAFGHSGIRAFGHWGIGALGHWAYRLAQLDQVPVELVRGAEEDARLVGVGVGVRVGVRGWG